MMDELGVDVIYHADETPIFFEYIPTSNIQKNDDKTDIKQLKQIFSVQIYGNNTGWWNIISATFLRYQFGDGVDMTKPVLLLWDNVSVHWTNEVIVCAKELNIELMLVPADYTCVCQPADVCRNKPLKQRIRSLWVKDPQYQLDQADGRAFKPTQPARK
ncbi:DNA binding protein [Phytophthora cinnamomi]|uniref:DNA binding protein n=1 Tax=Phytophthora cinnamomi TaxID=4785 RepID=UPI003559CD53|nr:DNA binding protein [Phytophthora cinnamomi]